MSRGAGTGISIRHAQVLAGLFLGLKLLHLIFAGVFMDEAYYWMWGQHPALSYFDHPPLNSWLLGASAAVFGWNQLALRLPVALSLAADIVALWLFSKRVAGEAWRPHFWLTLVLFLATPFFFVVSGVALPDHLLLTACLYALYFFLGFFADRETGAAGRSRDLYLAALFLGLAGLAKYNAAFLGLGVVLYVLMRHRALLREPRLYLAAILTLALQAPVVVWNATEGYASWEFILNGRHAGLQASADGLWTWLFNLLFFLSPFLLVAMGRFVFERPARPGEGLARTIFILSSVAILAISTMTLTLFHWNLVAYAALLPFLAFYMRPRWLVWAQIAYGAVVTLAAVFNYTIFPLTSDVRGLRDESSNWLYGWSETVAAVEAAKAQYHASFIATPDYTTASLLGFALHDKEVVSLSERTDAFDYWFDPKRHAGEDALLFGDRYRPLRPAFEKQFESVTLIDTIEVMRFGRLLDVDRIYLGKGFKPDV